MAHSQIRIPVVKREIARIDTVPTVKFVYDTVEHVTVIVPTVRYDTIYVKQRRGMCSSLLRGIMCGAALVGVGCEVSKLAFDRPCLRIWNRAKARAKAEVSMSVSLPLRFP